MTFQKGQSGNPNGRPRKEREDRLYDIAVNTLTFDDWKQVVKRAVEQAKRGDAVARKWLGDNLMGVPIQRSEITGKDGETLKILVEYADSKPDIT